MTQLEISGTTTTHTEHFYAAATISGLGPVRGYVGVTDVDLIPDRISANWNRADGSPGRLGSCVVTGFRLLKSGALGEQRAEWCPTLAEMPPELSAWIRDVAPDATDR